MRSAATSILLPLLMLIFGCTPKNKSIELNDAATAIQWKVIGGELPDDSLVTAIDLYKQSIAQDSAYRLAYLNLYNCYKLLQEHEEAEKLCTEWLYRTPDDVDFRLKRANLYQVQDRHDLAKGEYLILSEWLASAYAPKIDSNMNASEIEQVIVRAYNIFIINDDAAGGLELLEKLQSISPPNGSIEQAIRQISSHTRDQYLDQLHGFRGQVNL